MKRYLAVIALALFAAAPARAVTSLNFLDASSASHAGAFDQDGSSRYFALEGLYGIAGDYQVDAFSDHGLGVHVLNTSAGLNVSIQNGPTVIASSAYTVNWAVGGLQTVSFFRTTAQPSGLLSSVTVASAGGMTATLTIYGFRKSPASTCTDGQAFVLSSSDLQYLIPGFPITVGPQSLNGTTQTIGTTVIAPAASTKNADGTATTDLYFCPVTNGTPTFTTSTDLTFIYGGIQD